MYSGLQYVACTRRHTCLGGRAHSLIWAPRQGSPVGAVIVSTLNGAEGHTVPNHKLPDTCMSFLTLAKVIYIDEVYSKIHDWLNIAQFGFLVCFFFSVSAPRQLLFDFEEKAFLKPIRLNYFSACWECDRLCCLTEHFSNCGLLPRCVEFIWVGVARITWSSHQQTARQITSRPPESKSKNLAVVVLQACLKT